MLNRRGSVGNKLSSEIGQGGHTEAADVFAMGREVIEAYLSAEGKSRSLDRTAVRANPSVASAATTVITTSNATGCRGAPEPKATSSASVVEDHPNLLGPAPHNSAGKQLLTLHQNQVKPIWYTQWCRDLQQCSGCRDVAKQTVDGGAALIETYAACLEHAPPHR
jgi:hypothetical protein